MKKHKGLFVLLIVMVAILAGCLAACDKVQEIIMDAPADVYYDGQYLTWDKVDADYYTVSINGGEAQRVNSTTYAYASPGTDFDVTVAAVKGEASKSVSKTFHPLATIEELNVYNDGTLWWNPVAGANAYEVQVNGQVAGQVTDASYDALTAGNSRVKVKPIVSGDNSFYSSWSAEKRVNIYATPTDIDYDGTTLSWRGNGRTYEVTINGQIQTVTATRYDFNSDNRDFDVTIKALGDYTNNFDSAVAEESFTYLDPVTDITVEDGILKWQGVEDAQGYRVRVGATVYNVTEGTQYDGLPAGDILTVSVMPYNDGGNYFSSWSAAMTFSIALAPELTWSNELDTSSGARNNVRWEPIYVADDYLVEITYPDGRVETETLVDGKVEYGNDFTDVGTYIIRVKSLVSDTSGSVYDSKFSAPLYVRRLAPPRAALNNFIVSNPDKLSDGFTVNFIPAEGASGYKLYREGSNDTQSVDASSTSIKVSDVIGNDIAVGMSLRYFIQSSGSPFTEANGIKYVSIDSRTDVSLAIPITVLPMPEWPASNEEMIQNGSTILNWRTNSAAVNGYTVKYNSTIARVNNGNTIDLASTLGDVGGYEVSVCATGDGAGVLASNYNAAVMVTRLGRPEGIEINEVGTITFSNYNSADNTYGGYRIYFSGNTATTSTTEINNMNERISTAGTTVFAIVVGNMWKENEYCLESQPSASVQFIRLAAPTFGTDSLRDQTTLKWEFPANINPREYQPNYQVFNGQDSVRTVTDEELSLSVFVAGNYNITVQAVGDGVRYVSSEPSVELSFLKLATPELSVRSDGYWWNSVLNATSYRLVINGTSVSDELHGITGNWYNYMPSFDGKNTTYTVELYAVGNGNADIGVAANVNTVQSNILTFEQKVADLSTPDISAEYRVGEKRASYYEPGGYIAVTVTTPSTIGSQWELLPDSKGNVTTQISYQFNAGMSYVGKPGEMAYSVPVDAPHTYRNINANARGGIFAIDKNVMAEIGTFGDVTNTNSSSLDFVRPEDTVYYRSSAASSSITIDILSKPQNFTMSKNGNAGYLSWGIVASAAGYEYYIIADGKEIAGSAESPLYSSGSSVRINNVGQYREIKIYVRAAGNSSGTLVGSEWAEWVYNA